MASSEDDPKGRRNILMVLGIVAGVILILWIRGLIQENRAAVHALYVLEKLKERSESNAVVKSALDVAEHDYQEWQEEKRIESQAERR